MHGQARERETDMSNATDTLTVHDYRTGEELGELSAELTSTYAEELAAMSESERAVGAVDGERYGYPDRTIYAM